jgi:hypothetical protein
LVGSNGVGGWVEMERGSGAKRTFMYSFVNMVYYDFLVLIVKLDIEIPSMMLYFQWNIFCIVAIYVANIAELKCTVTRACQVRRVICALIGESKL